MIIQNLQISKIYFLKGEIYLTKTDKNGYLGAILFQTILRLLVFGKG